MGVGIDFAGRFRRNGLLSRTRPPEKCLDAMEAWFKREVADLLLSSQRGRGQDGLPALAVTLHPAAESVDVTAGTGGRVTVGSKTSTAGPGFHAYLCDALKCCATDLNIEWSPGDPEAGSGDPTGYFATGDFSAVRREMLSWLGATVRSVSDMLTEDYSGLALSLPPDVSFHHEEVLATPMGPRSAQWIREVADNPVRGVDIFPWWEQGTGAAFHLGRALARMWTDVRWRTPQSDAARRVIEAVLHDLARAHSLDPGLSYPWREWHELNALVGRTGALADFVARRAIDPPDGPLVGYRRRDVTANVTGKWRIDVPGSFETIDNGDSWQAFDEVRVVYFSSLAVGGGPSGPPPPEQLLTTGFPSPEGKLLETFEHRGPRVIGKGALVEAEEGGRTVWRLLATCAVRGGVGICTIDLYDPSHRQWALDTWKSIDHPSE